MLPCPICARPSEAREKNRAFPFCSPRCKQVDLGQWLDQKYCVQTPLGESADNDAAPFSSSDPPGDKA
jgi:hypothetical protein